MNLRTSILAALVLCAVNALTGCSGGKIIIAPPEGQLPVRALLLPLNTEVELTREHREAIDREMLAALRNRGYLVGRLSQELQSKSDVSTVQLTLTDFRRDTVFAGYVNYIAGTLQVTDGAGTVISESNYAESEKGGLLFNSGQVLVGLQSEVSNFRDEGFADWIEEFADGLARTLPKPASTVAVSDTLVLEVRSAQLRLAGGQAELCALGTPGQTAVLTAAAIRLPLREVSPPGRYCIVLPQYISAERVVNGTVELTNSFGFRAKSPIQTVPRDLGCPAQRIRGKVNGEEVYFEVVCSDAEQVSNAAAVEQTQCALVGECKDVKFRVYKLNPEGAYLLVGEFGVDGFQKVFAESKKPLAVQDFRLFRLSPDSRYPNPIQLEAAEDQV